MTDRRQELGRIVREEPHTDSDIQRPVLLFVGGAPRSGTTLLQSMLDSHPGVYGAPEFLGLLDLMRLRRKMHAGYEMGHVSALYTPERRDRVLRRAIEDFLLPLSDPSNHKVFSEKSPSNVLVFSDLRDLFPRARFIFMARDPRATVASMLKVGRRGLDKGWRMPRYTKTTSDAANFVKECMEAGLSFSAQHPDCSRVIRYEQLVGAPELCARNLCEFLGLSWDTRMLNPSAIEHPGAEVIINDVWYDRESYYRDPESVEVDKWKRELGPDQQATITRVMEASGLFHTLEYGLSAPSVPLAVQVLGLPKRATSGLKARVRAWLR